MTAPPFAFVLGNILDNIQIQLPETLVIWLTPIWILSLGFLLGLLACAALWGLASLLCRLPVLGTLDENPTAWRVVVGVLFLAMAIGGNIGVQRSFGSAAPAAEAAAPAIVDRVVAGAAVCAAAFLAALAIVTLLSRKTVEEIPLAVQEGVLNYYFITAVAISSFAILGLTVVRRPSELLSVMYRYPQLVAQGNPSKTYTISAPETEFGEPPQTTIPVNFKKSEIRKLSFTSDQLVKIRTEPFDSPGGMSALFTVAPQDQGGEADPQQQAGAQWVRTPNGIVPFSAEEVRELYVKNYGNGPATLTMNVTLGLAHTEMLLVPYVMLFVVGVFVLYLLQRSAMPKLAAVALSTAKSDIAQPIYIILLVLTACALVLFLFIPYYTLGEDIRMYKNASLELLLVIAIIQAVWAASSSVSEEIEGRTALTVLSKPVSRRDFILGKFFGIAWSVGWMCMFLGLVMLVVVAYKPLYDAREGAAAETPVWQNCFREMVEIIPGIALAYLETLVMAALSVAISTRLPMLANFIITFSIYTLGHLTPLLVQSQTVADNVPAPVIFLAQILATVLPVLDHFNIQANIAAGKQVPLDYVGWSLLYCTLYSAVAMLVALTLFEDRDLA
jgi:ABC-type transport system involved in multi-copper enzyme maturation permease subunit